MSLSPTSNSEPENRRLARISFPVEFLVNHVCFANDKRIVEVADGVPAGAKLVRFGYDIFSDSVEMIFEHDSFCECCPGTTPLKIYPTYRVIEKPHEVNKS